MSFSDDLIDLNEYQSNGSYIDYQNDENKSQSNNDLWLDEKQDSPMFDIKDWPNEFDTGNSGMTKLVSSEEDIISLNGSYSAEDTCTIKRKSQSEKVLTNLNSVTVDKDMETNDGFASNDVLTIGEHLLEEELKYNVEKNQEPSMAEHWGNTSYETVLRTNYVNIQNNGAMKPVNAIIVKKRHHSESNIKSLLCSICNKTVYTTEKLVVNKRLYHHHCFRCAKCHGRLRMNSFGVISTTLFCMPHYLEVFNQKGRYDNIDLQSLGGRCVQPSADDTEDKYNEMPPHEIIKCRLEIFRQLESNNEAELVKDKRNSSFTKGNIVYPGTTPITGVVKEDKKQHALDEMPTPGITKSLLQHWNSIGSSQRQNIHNTDVDHKNIPKITMVNSSSQVEDICQHYPEPITSTEGVVKTYCSKSYVTLYRDLGANSQLSCPAPFYSLTEPKASVLDKDKVEKHYSVNGSASEIDQTNELPEEGITRNLVDFFQAMKETM